MQVRPTYESEIDRQREERVAHVMSAHLDIRFAGDKHVVKKCPKYYPCDWGIYYDPLMGKVRLAYLLEVKVREKQFAQYMVSLHKASAIIQMATYARCSALLAVYWEDVKQIGFVDLQACAHTVGYGGRSDRADNQDHEPMVYIPVSEFETFQPGMII